MARLLAGAPRPHRAAATMTATRRATPTPARRPPRLAEPDGRPTAPRCCAAPRRWHGMLVHVRRRRWATRCARAQQLSCIEAMKMEHVITRRTPAAWSRCSAAPGDTCVEGQPLAFIEPVDAQAAADEAARRVDLDAIRPDLAEVHRPPRADARRQRGPRRWPSAARRPASAPRARTSPTSVDPGSFIEYGALRSPRSAPPLARGPDRATARPTAWSPASAPSTASCSTPSSRAASVLAYDYTVFAGTQGMQQPQEARPHARLAEQLAAADRALRRGRRRAARRHRHADRRRARHPQLRRFAALSGLVPLVGIVLGPLLRRQRGAARLLRRRSSPPRTSNIGMGGPAMIEGGGLGVFTPEEIGPIDVQAPTASSTSRSTTRPRRSRPRSSTSPTSRARCRMDVRRPAARCATSMPENRLRVYDVRARDRGRSPTPARCSSCAATSAPACHRAGADRGPAGRRIANNPQHLGGAIDADGADKAARFMQLCDAFRPAAPLALRHAGLHGRPEIESPALVRHVRRMFVAAAPACACRSSPSSCARPTASARRRWRRRLPLRRSSPSPGRPASSAPWASRARCASAIARSWRRRRPAPSARRCSSSWSRSSTSTARRISMARTLEIDAVIDPAETRAWLVRGLDSAHRPPGRPFGCLHGETRHTERKNAVARRSRRVHLPWQRGIGALWLGKENLL